MLSKLKDVFRFVVSWPPNVGVCIALLAVVAVVMATRGDRMLGPEKTTWILCSFVLLIGEIYAMQTKVVRDANDAIAARKAENDRFAAILNQNQTDFEATVSRLDNVAELTERSLKSMLGGDSFCYMTFLDGLRPITVSEGDYPLYDVKVRIVDLSVPFPTTVEKGNTLEKFKEECAVFERTFEMLIDIGNIAVKSCLLHRESVPFDPTHGNFNLFFSARNGRWIQNYRSTFVAQDKKVRAIRIIGDPETTKVLFEQIDEDYPKNADGTVNW